VDVDCGDSGDNGSLCEDGEIGAACWRSLVFPVHMVADKQAGKF